ncbi:hypothetical protein [Alkalimarinus alittae]|uniref:Uncharacterized protein n=1 Tax=Alkalimarinus alittae TaxID=2961619 RepID=A0ABY6MYJ9_9ALTE|nr:hypothetical protein [Alkalimarinus alittae]UZE94898.1 hypothetical protein NKI27_12520 [Alkalimarinus alittae]
MSVAKAEMQPMGDVELSEHVGQAMIAFDTKEGATAADPSTTRFTMGLNTEFQINIDDLEVGNYVTADTLTSDLNISNLSYGSISTDAAKIQLDGNTYAVGDIVPFMANTPYFEMSENGAGELVGFRVGFNEARGQLSGDFKSFSGNLGMDVIDAAGVTHKATLLDQSGLADNTRSTNIGIDAVASGNAGAGCTVATYCYDISKFKTLDIGERNALDGSTDITKDFFISMQKENVPWTTSTGNITAGPGAFINLPTSMVIDASAINANGGVYGTERVRTEYIDRGTGLF